MTINTFAEAENLVDQYQELLSQAAPIAARVAQMRGLGQNRSFEDEELQILYNTVYATYFSIGGACKFAFPMYYLFEPKWPDIEKLRIEEEKRQKEAARKDSKEKYERAMYERLRNKFESKEDVS